MTITVQPLPDHLREPIAEIRDQLELVVEATALPSEAGRLAASAAAMAALLLAAGFMPQARMLTEGVQHLDKAAAIWTRDCAEPAVATSREFDDAAFEAFDCVSWTLDLEHQPDLVPAHLQTFDVRAA